jgi:iron complex outermembrane recepter protein
MFFISSLETLIPATDKGYYVGGLAQGAAFGSNSALPGIPRMYGMELNYKF